MAAIQIRGRFAPGSKVTLRRRTSTALLPGAREVATATVDKNGDVTFSSLREGEQFFATDGTRNVAVTAKNQQDVKKLSDREVREILASTRPAQVSGVVTGQRSTVTGAAFHRATGEPTAKEDREAEPQPHPRQEDMRNVDQRSATLTGQATPVEPGEPQPYPSQQDYRDANQRSATEWGQATPKDLDEAVPFLSQDFAGKLDQRSATEKGEAVPKPKAKPVRQEKVRESAEAKAKHGELPPPEAGVPTTTSEAKPEKESQRPKRKAPAKKRAAKSASKARKS